MLALVSYGSEVVKDANSDFGQSHIVPELLTLFWTKRTNCFTFDEDLSTNMEVHKVLMPYLLTMEVNREIILSYMRYSTLIEYDFQSILVHIFNNRKDRVPYGLFGNIRLSHNNIVSAVGISQD